MSNSFGGRDWALDTAFSTALTDRFFVARMQWEPTTAGHTLTVKDKNGNVKWQSTALAAVGVTGPEVWENPDPRLNYFDGFDLDTIEGGTLRVNLV